MSDPTLLASSLPVIQKVAPAALSKLAAVLKTGSNKIRVRLTSTFQKHLEVTYARCANVKTLFSGDKPVSLKSIYVNLYLKSDGTIVKDNDLADETITTRHCVITGTGGAGKTMIMRHVALLHHDRPNGTIPIFAELRNLPHHKPEQFLRAVFDLVTPSKQHDEYDLFVEGMRVGIFTLFLDGLDEVAPEMREDVHRSIQRLAIDFHAMRVIASTRPEIDVEQWETFSNFHVQGLNISQVNLLIKRVTYEEEIKAAFLARVNDGMFDEHKTFMSIPLLCSLMLLTYGEYADIPSRLTVFYEQAFETLYRRHDSLKGPFKRRHVSNLSVDRFRYLFSAFCYRTLAKSTVTFTDDELRRHLSKAAEVCEIEVDIEKFSADLVSAVCLIMRDGLNLHFIHRSFQECFAALYILRYRGENSFEVFDQVFTDSFISNILGMAIDIDFQTVERIWALPTVRQISKAVSGWGEEERWFKLLQSTFYEMKMNENGKEIYGWSWLTENRMRTKIVCLAQMYPDSGVSVAAFNGELQDGFNHICELADKAYAPRELKIACKDLPSYLDENEDLEFETGMLQSEFLEHTTLPVHMTKLCDDILRLKRELERRASHRKKLNLLS